MANCSSKEADFVLWNDGNVNVVSTMVYCIFMSALSIIDSENAILLVILSNWSWNISRNISRSTI
jgi:hypothetical protein